MTCWCLALLNKLKHWATYKCYHIHTGPQSSISHSPVVISKEPWQCLNIVGLMLCKHRLSLTGFFSLTCWQYTSLVWLPWSQSTEHYKRNYQNYHFILSLTLFQSDVIHWYSHFSSSLGFIDMLQLFASISIPWEFLQVIFLVLVQDEEH